MTMNIGFDAKRIFYNQSGLGNYGRNIINTLQSVEDEIILNLYSPIKNNPLIEYNNPKIHVINPSCWFYKNFGSLWRTFALSKKIMHDEIDIFHGLSNEIPHNIHKKSIKSIVTIHDLIFLRYPELYKRIDRNIYNRKFKYACNAATRIIAISEQTKQDIVDFYKIPADKIDVVYQGCNPIFLRKINNTEEIKKKYNLPSQYMLTVGTIEKRKNLLTILKAITSANIDIPLVVVGKPTNYISQVEEFIQSSGLKKVHILNYLPLDELPALYQGAMLFLYPSIFEGFGIPVLEAISSGIPVISTNYGCFKEAGGEASIYVDPENPDEMAEAILSIVNDENKQKDMIDAGYKHAEKFRDEVIAKELMKVYKKALQND